MHFKGPVQQSFIADIKEMRKESDAKVIFILDALRIGAKKFDEGSVVLKKKISEGDYGSVWYFFSFHLFGIDEF